LKCPANKGFVSSHYDLAIYIKKHLKAKEETQIFHHAKIYLIFKKCSKKKIKILQDIITLL
jgi:hypothetical protein